MLEWIEEEIIYLADLIKKALESDKRFKLNKLSKYSIKGIKQGLGINVNISKEKEVFTIKIEYQKSLNCIHCKSQSITYKSENTYSCNSCKKEFKLK